MHTFFLSENASPSPRRLAPSRCAVLCACLFVLLTCVSFRPPVAAAAAPEATAEAREDALFLRMKEKAKALAAGSYQNPSGQVPDFLLHLNQDQWKAIRFQSARQPWKLQGTDFAVEFVHPGFVYDRAVNIFVVENGELMPQVFSPDMFSYRQDLPEAKIRETSLGFAGIRLYHSPVGNGSGRRASQELAVFAGATYFQSKGRHADYGLSARASAVNTAEAEGEEFPYFRELWPVRPQPGDTSFTMYALMDSPSLTGAYRFVITPGTAAIMDVQSTLFARSGAGFPQKIGIAPMSGMFLFSETGRGNPDDYRPEVHNTDGLLYHTGGDNWFRRPLSNPSRLAVQRFPMHSPAGFGLMQQDADFDHYQDLAARFERRSSLWVEPRGDWGRGHIELVEIPTRVDFHSNINVFWVPEQIRSIVEETSPVPPLPALPPPADEASPAGSGNSGRELSYAYRLYWTDPGITPHTLGRAVATRMLRQGQGDIVRFLIDFESESLNALPADTGLSSFIEMPDQAMLVEKQLMKNEATGGWRLDFTVRLPRQDGVIQSLITAREGFPRLCLRALLKKGENLPDPLTEVWVYDLPVQ